jgi:tetratricopeptide (TPR) repeat protein
VAGTAGPYPGRRGDRILARMLQVAHGTLTLARALAELAELEFRLGAWSAAYACAVEALKVVRAGGPARESMNCLVRLAIIEAGRGDADACRSHAGEAIRLSRRYASMPAEALAREATGLLELGLGRVDAAIEWFESVARLCREHPQAAMCATWAPDLADACLRRGDRAGAERALASLEGRARGSGDCALAAAAERARAMLAVEDAFEWRFRRALSWHARAREPFEHARTELCFGERLRRARRPREARGHLSAALETFAALGARPWAERAARELAA